jgi:hypothetical protein
MGVPLKFNVMSNWHSVQHETLKIEVGHILLMYNVTAEMPYRAWYLSQSQSWRMPSPGMLRLMALARIDVSEALRSSDTSILIRAIRRNISKDGIIHSHRSGNLKCYKVRVILRQRSVGQSIPVKATIRETRPISFNSVDSILRHLDFFAWDVLPDERTGPVSYPCVCYWTLSLSLSLLALSTAELETMIYCFISC